MRWLTDGRAASAYRPSARVLMFAFAAAVVVGGCASSAPIVTPRASDASPAPLAPELAAAVAQRQAFDLRSDADWVVAVAADPRATSDLLGIPLLPQEDAALRRQQATLFDIADAAKAYGAERRDEFGGVYIDQQRHVVVASFRGGSERHHMAILARLGRFGPVEVRDVPYSEAMLDALLGRLTSTWGWMEDLAAAPLSATVDVPSNAVILSVSSANPDAAAAIRERYGVPADMLQIVSDGTGVALLPWGTIRGRVVRTDGRPPGPNALNLVWRSAGPGACGRLDVAFGVAADGSFELPCTVGTWIIRVEVPTVGGWEDVGSGEVTVQPDEAARLVLRLRPGASVTEP